MKFILLLYYLLIQLFSSDSRHKFEEGMLLFPPVLGLYGPRPAPSRSPLGKSLGTTAPLSPSTLGATTLGRGSSLAGRQKQQRSQISIRDLCQIF